MYSAPLLKRIFQILNALLEEKSPLSLTEIATRCNINKSTTFGILRALQREGYIRREEKTRRYAISAGLAEFAKRVIKKVELAHISRPFLERLLSLFDETVFLGVRDENSIRIVDVLEPRKELRITSRIGAKLPLTAGATGKVALSFMEEKDLRDLIRQAGLRRYTENTVCEEERFVEEVLKVRGRGYAIDLEEYMKGVWAVASPVLLDGNLLAIVWIVGFMSLLEEQRLPSITEEVKNTAHLISVAYKAWA